MRILLVMGSYYPELHFGGSTQKLYELSLGLVARGHDVEVLTFHSDKALGGTRTTIQGVKVQYLPWIGKGSWRVPLKLSLLRNAVAESDAVHCFGLYSLLCAAAASAAQRQQRPYFIEPLGMYVPRGRQLLAKKLYNQVFTKWMLSRAAAVIVTSQTEYDELSDAVSGSQLYLRRDGIRPEFLQNCSQGDGFRNQFGIDASERVVLFLGRISRIKNLDQLIMAFKSASIENSRLVLVGPSDEPDYQLRLERIVDEEQLGKKVIFTGPLYEDQKLPAFAAADLFVLPSHYESYGLAAAEAAAAGVPVLITKNCGIASLIDGRAGLAVRAEVEELSKGMRTLLCDDSERERVTALRSEVLNDLTWDKPLDQLEAIYRKSAIDLSTRQISPQFS